MKKKDIVENDKLKIAELITQLDHKKNEALEGAYERVNAVRETWEKCKNIFLAYFSANYMTFPYL